MHGCYGLVSALGAVPTDAVVKDSDLSKEITPDVDADAEVSASEVLVEGEALPVAAAQDAGADDVVELLAVDDPGAEVLSTADRIEGAAVDEILTAVGELASRLDRFNERAQAQEALIQKMQERITELQGDQVRALLSPLFQELASLHADLLEAAAKDYSLLPPERLPKELSFLVDRVETALELVGLESVKAAPGIEFDSRLHSAARRVPTGDPSLDRHIERVQRQGFTFPGAAKASLYARVTVYSFDPALVDDGPPIAPPAPVEPNQQPRPAPAGRPVVVNPLHAPVPSASAQAEHSPYITDPVDEPPERIPNVPVPPLPTTYNES